MPSRVFDPAEKALANSHSSRRAAVRLARRFRGSHRATLRVAQPRAKGRTRLSGRPLGGRRRYGHSHMPYDVHGVNESHTPHFVVLPGLCGFTQARSPFMPRSVANQTDSNSGWTKMKVEPY